MKRFGGFEKLVLMLIIIVTAFIIVVLFPRKQGIDYVRDMKDRRIGEITEVYHNESTESEDDYFVVNNKEKGYLVILNEQGGSVKNYTVTVISKSDIELNRMLEKSIKGDDDK